MEKNTTPNLPFYFKRIATFLNNVKVSKAQQDDLDLAKQALKEIFVTIYGKPIITCPVDVPLVPPIQD
jgi:hypothetical protein